MRTDEHSLAKINLTQSFLIVLTSHIDVAEASQVTSMKPIRQKVIEIWMNLMKRSLQIASTVLADGNVVQALQVVSESLKHREQVEKQVIKVPCSSSIGIIILVTDILYVYCLSQGFQTRDPHYDQN